MSSNFLRLPSERVDMIASNLAPIHRASLLRALGWHRTNQYILRKNKNFAYIWDYIFKTDVWIRRFLEIQNTYEKGPTLALVGRDLNKGKFKTTKLTLLVNDWTGDVRYEKDLFFESLRDYEYDEESSVIRLKRSAIGSLEWIPMGDPSKLFCLRGGKLSTYAIYYTEDILYNIGPSQIGGVEGLSIKKKKAVRDICSIKLKFGDDSPVYRVFLNPTKAVKVVNVQVRDENGRDWVACWRVARPYEREWWP